MRFKQRLRYKFKFTATTLLLTFGAGTKVYSQNTAHAVMEVKVTIVSGSQLSNNLISDVGNALEQSKGPFSMGNFQLTVPEGADYHITQNSTINMRGGNEEWKINLKMRPEKTGIGQTTYHLEGDTLSRIPKGSYSGTHVTQIEYL